MGRRQPVRFGGHLFRWVSVVIALLLLMPLAAFSQGKKELEDKRKKLLRDIEMTGGLLKKTTRTKEATYDRFVALQSQIERREKVDSQHRSRNSRRRNRHRPQLGCD